MRNDIPSMACFLPPSVTFKRIKFFVFLTKNQSRNVFIWQMGQLNGKHVKESKQLYIYTFAVPGYNRQDMKFDISSRLFLSGSRTPCCIELVGPEIWPKSWVARHSFKSEVWFPSNCASLIGVWPWSTKDKYAYTSQILLSQSVRYSKSIPPSDCYSFHNIRVGRRHLFRETLI